MTAPPGTDRRDEEFWRDFLSHPDTMMSFGRRVLSRIPASPRCQLCASPFAGPGGPVMRLIGKYPSAANPNMCNTCEKVLIKHHGGAEIEATMLFADIRGSTALAERMSPGEFHALLDRFYTAASEVVFRHNGVVDKFVGDELVAAFPPMYDDSHAARAIETGRAVLEATGHSDPAGPWAPVGVGIHTGRAWFGAVGEGLHVELTIVGDSVNTAARLAAAAGSGEVVVSSDAAGAARLELDGLERRTLELKGKEAPVDVVVLKANTGFIADTR
jgi:adenylate cyclase